MILWAETTFRLFFQLPELSCCASLLTFSVSPQDINAVFLAKLFACRCGCNQIWEKKEPMWLKEVENCAFWPRKLHEHARFSMVIISNPGRAVLTMSSNYCEYFKSCCKISTQDFHTLPHQMHWLVAPAVPAAEKRWEATVDVGLLSEWGTAPPFICSLSAKVFNMQMLWISLFTCNPDQELSSLCCLFWVLSISHGWAFIDARQWRQQK